MKTLCIQAGGKSSRMGHDKGLINFCGKALLQNVIDNLASISEEIFIITDNNTAYHKFGYPIFKDHYPNYGPLAGLYTGLITSKNEIVYMVACDMPFANADIFLYMNKIIEIGEADVVIPLTKKGYEPFHAVYRKSSCLKAVEFAIKQKKKRLISWFDQVKVIAVGETQLKKFDPNLNAFSNINTPDDLIFAEENCN
jgi:molybdopterin-guanine dinucleotide biosynthesis protein A